jgi:hypothetical protein
MDQNTHYCWKLSKNFYLILGSKLGLILTELSLKFGGFSSPNARFKGIFAVFQGKFRFFEVA